MSELDGYTCAEAFRRLDDYLDRELSAAEMRRVDAHLQLCAACAREFRYEDSVLRHVREKVRQISLPPDLEARIGAALAEAERNAG